MRSSIGSSQRPCAISEFGDTTADLRLAGPWHPAGNLIP